MSYLWPIPLGTTGYARQRFDSGCNNCRRSHKCMWDKQVGLWEVSVSGEMVKDGTQDRTVEIYIKKKLGNNITFGTEPFLLSLNPAPRRSPPTSILKFLSLSFSIETRRPYYQPIRKTVHPSNPRKWNVQLFCNLQLNQSLEWHTKISLQGPDPFYSARVK